MQRRGSDFAERTRRRAYPGARLVNREGVLPSVVLPNPGADSKPNRCCQVVGQQEPESRFCPFMDSGRPFRSAGPLDRGEGSLTRKGRCSPTDTSSSGQGVCQGPGSLGSGSVRHPGQQAALGPCGEGLQEPGVRTQGHTAPRSEGWRSSSECARLFLLARLGCCFHPPSLGPGQARACAPTAFPHVSSCCRSTAPL